MKQRASTVTVILVNWNSGPLLAECLETLRNQLPPERMRIVVVDNDSADLSVDLAAPVLPEATFVRNRENIGFARANNQVLATFDTDYALLLNPDTRLSSGFLQQLIAYADANPTIGALGPRLEDPGGRFRVRNGGEQPTLKTITNHFLFLSTIFAGRRWSRGFQLMQDPPGPQDVGWLCGACLLLRRDALKAVGLLDERWFLHTEDVEICDRIRSAGWQVVYHPGLMVTHLVGSGRRGSGERVPDMDRPGTWIGTVRGYFVWRSRASRAALVAFDAVVGLGLLIRSAIYYSRSLSPRRGSEWREEALSFLNHAREVWHLHQRGWPEPGLLRPRIPRLKRD